MPTKEQKILGKARIIDATLDLSVDSKITSPDVSGSSPGIITVRVSDTSITPIPLTSSAAQSVSSLFKGQYVEVSGTNLPSVSAQSQASELALKDEIAELELIQKKKGMLRFIRLFHRGPDGYVVFSHDNPETGEWEDICSIQVSHLETIFPPFLYEYLFETGRMSTHSMFKARPFATNKLPKLPLELQKTLPAYYRESYKGESKIKYRGGLPGPYRGDEKDKFSPVKYLTCCWADIDIHKLNVPPSLALAAIKEMQDRNKFPRASIIGFSGRGMWVYWLLVDSKNPYAPPRLGPGTWERESVWRRVQRHIQGLFGELGADLHAATLLTASVRLPGTIHAETGKPAEYWFSTDGESSIYTLEQMADFFGIIPMELSPIEQKLLTAPEVSSQKGDKKHNRFLAVHKSFLKQFHALWEIRGKFADGHRHHAALIYAVILYRNGMPKPEMLSLVTQFVETGCETGKKPLNAAKVAKSAVSGAMRMTRDKRTGHGGWHSKQQIADLLNITPSEAQLLDTWPAARSFNYKIRRRKVHPAKLKAGQVRSEVQKIMDEATAAGAKIPTCRDMQKILAKRGYHLSHVTVNYHINMILYGTKTAAVKRKRSQGKLAY
jgi:hypothetical protein